MRVPLEMQSVYGKAIQHPIHQNVTVFFALVTRIGVVPEINLGLNTIRNIRFLADSASSNERTYVMCEYPFGLAPVIFLPGITPLQSSTPS